MIRIILVISGIVGGLLAVSTDIPGHTHNHMWNLVGVGMLILVGLTYQAGKRNFMAARSKYIDYGWLDKFFLLLW